MRHTAIHPAADADRPTGTSFDECQSYGGNQEEETRFWDINTRHETVKNARNIPEPGTQLSKRHEKQSRDYEKEIALEGTAKSQSLLLVRQRQVED